MMKNYKRNLVLIFSTVLLSFFLIPLVIANSQTPTNKLNKPIVVENNQWTVSIPLPANATTGFQWYLKDYNDALVRPKSYNYQLDTKKTDKDKNADTVGQGGFAVFKLTVTKRFKSAPQMTQLTFVYKRPWENHSEDKTQTITLLSSPIYPK